MKMDPCERDDIQQVQSSFCLLALLLKDLYQSFRQGDGERIFRNARFELLFYHTARHYKYRLYVWRMLACEKAILSERDASEYKWNSVVNLKGGDGEYIPCENMLEINIDLLKRKLRAQGANMTVDTSKVAAQTLQVHQKLKEFLRQETCAKINFGHHHHISKLKYIELMAKDLLQGKCFNHICNRNSTVLKNSVDPLQTINLVEFCKWMEDQKERGAVEMV